MRRLPAFFAIVAMASPAFAQEGALVALHKVQREGGQLCFADHHHQGESRPMPTQAAAFADAERSWAGLTVLEYGAAWGQFRNSASRQVRCMPRETLQGAAWVCHVRSRPCRPDMAAQVASPAGAKVAGRTRR